MKLTWHGHSCFTLDTTQGRVILDPYRDDVVPGLAPLRLAGDLLLCSHNHRDHGATEVVTLSGRNPAISVDALPTFHDPEQGALRGENLIHIISAQGMRVAHMGDIGCMPEPSQLQQLQGLDALMIPVGGYYTIDAKQAQALIEQLAPRVVIPMHYRSDTFGFEVIDHLDTFLALCKNVVYYDSNTLDLSLDTRPQTAVLRYQG